MLRIPFSVFRIPALGTAAYVALYLWAIVAANLTVVRFGPPAVIFNAVALIGLDLTCRDVLHERWAGRLWLPMGGLIAAGSLLTFVVNGAAGRVALASLAAFAAAAVIDALLYTALYRRSYALRVNGSNFVSAAVDSVLFPWLAFGALDVGIVLGLWSAKVVGGALWAWLLRWSVGGQA